ncbi:hypothetical protein VIGAN_08160200 [Vigna angularis var. angularis]|uniref:Uncharacterized protein n=1 Tax=Vigna angularis var. angularis TaxID=157739 RepID=A0A0S3SQ22_PHAAN|nr:hypothetical protein VIGAN_08160200 [Vigna angularis var. angularis]
MGLNPNGRRCKDENRDAKEKWPLFFYFILFFFVFFLFLFFRERVGLKKKKTAQGPLAQETLRGFSHSLLIIPIHFFFSEQKGAKGAHLKRPPQSKASPEATVAGVNADRGASTFSLSSFKRQQSKDGVALPASCRLCQADHRQSVASSPAPLHVAVKPPCRYTSHRDPATANQLLRSRR